MMKRFKIEILCNKLVSNHSPSLSWSIPGCKMLRKRKSNTTRKIKVFYEKKEPQHTLFCRDSLVLSQFTRFLKGFHISIEKSHPAFIEL